MEENPDPGLLGSQSSEPQAPVPPFWSQMNRLGDLSLAVISVVLLFPRPYVSLYGSLAFCLLALLRVGFGPKVGLLAMMGGY